MKTIPTALAAHYATGCTTLADLLKITRTDGEVYAFTSGVDDVTIGGVVYQAAQGLSISSLESSSGFSVDNLELTTVDDGSTFTKIDVLSGRWRNAEFVISRYNWNSPSDGVEVRMAGTVGEVHLHRGFVTAELRGLQQYLQQPIGAISSKTCRARLGDSLCTKALSAFTYAGTVINSNSQQAFTGAFFNPGSVDADYSKVVLLLHCDGTNGSTTITDSGPLAKSPVRTGTGVISTAQSKFGGSSYQVPNATSFISVPNDADLNMGTGDFTIEAWIYPTAFGNFAAWMSKQNASYANFYFGYMASGLLYISVSGSSGQTGSSPSDIVLNSWNHVAVTRSGTTCRVFTNGVTKATFTSSANMSNTDPVMVGGGWSNSMVGYIDDARITKGLARYTADFTPPTAEFFPSLASAPADDYFSQGIVTWTSGAKTGTSAKVKSYNSSSFTLSVPLLSTISVGDTFNVVAGCQKRLTDCSAKFNNVVNFQGEPHLPGIDQITAPA